VLEDGLGRRGTEDDCHDAAGAPAARAGEDVGLEGPLEELGPGDGVARPSGPDRLSARGQEAASVGAAGGGGAGTTRGRTRALGAKTPK
jgi:hypothetical protein